MKCRSFYFDLPLLEDYWLRPQVSPHDVVDAVYALDEALAIVEEEGLEARWARHERNHRALVDGARGARPLACCRREGERLWTLNAVRVPDGVDEAAVRKHLLDEFNIEIGAGLGPLAGKIWRVGLMGASSSPRLDRPAARRARERAGASAGSTPDGSRVAAGGRARHAGRRRRSSVARSARSRRAFACSRTPTSRCPTSARCDRSNPSTTAFMELRAREARAKGQDAAPRPALGRATAASRRTSSARCSSPKTTRSGSTRASTSTSCRSRSRPTGRADSSRAARSTITQQLAKNLYLSPSKNPLRKLRELIIARRLEAELKKARILELYLNVIEWGDGIYGVGGGVARRTFSQPAPQLGPTESALLAGAIINPRLLNPARPTARLLRRQQLILRRMHSGVPAGTRKPSEPKLVPPIIEEEKEEEKLDDAKPGEEKGGDEKKGDPEKMIDR